MTLIEKLKRLFDDPNPGLVPAAAFIVLSISLGITGISLVLAWFFTGLSLMFDGHWLAAFAWLVGPGAAAALVIIAVYKDDRGHEPKGEDE
jgi:ABC-type Co2+ transport system permease subunit